MDKLPEGTDVKDQSETKPNLKVALDKDIDASSLISTPRRVCSMPAPSRHSD